MNRTIACLALFLCLSGAPSSGAPSNLSVASNPAVSPGPLLEKFLTDFDLPAAGREAEAHLRRHPADQTALFVRMETSELEERPDAVLDSALRLCVLSAPPRLQELASNRILEHAGNTQAFSLMVRRVKAALALHNS